MNKTTRDHIHRAGAEGEQAYRDGKPVTDNPYKEFIWGVGGFWRSGWYAAKGAAMSRLPNPTTSAPEDQK